MNSEERDAVIVKAMEDAQDVALAPALKILRELPNYMVSHQTLLDVLSCLGGMVQDKMKSSDAPLIAEALDLAYAEIEDIRDSLT